MTEVIDSMDKARKKLRSLAVKHGWKDWKISSTDGLTLNIDTWETYTEVKFDSEQDLFEYIEAFNPNFLLN